MGAEEQLLFDLVEAVLEGRPVDWTEAESTISESQRALLAHLRAVAGIASFHARSSALEAFRSAASDRSSVSPPLAMSDVFSSRAASAATVDAIPEGATWGSLRLLERVGHGAFGDVYRAWDPRLDREVALKLLRRVESRLDSVGSDVIDEGRLLARVRHPNVVTVYGADRIDGRVGLWMEFVRGRTLEAILGDQGPFGAHEATLIGLDLCRALSAVHSAGLIHRDVKAQNVMREADGRIVLMDFGTGREDLPERPLDLAGTPLYLAPEVFGGASATAQSDIYSVGVLLFHLVTGAYPVTGRTVADIREAHGQHRRTWLRDARPDLSDTFVQAVECALDVDPDKRYETAGATEAALVRVVSPTDTATSPSAAAPIISPPSARESGDAHALGDGHPTAALVAARTASHARAVALAGAMLLLVLLGVLALDVGGLRDRLRASVARIARPATATPSVSQLEGSASARNVRFPWSQTRGRPSRDGRYLPYTDLDGAVQVFEIATGRSRLVVARDAPNTSALASVMSPDGERVAYGWRTEEGAWELRAVNLDGTRPATLIPQQTAYEPVPIEWSRDGNMILCRLRRKDGQADLVLLSSTGGAPSVLKTLRDDDLEHASLSPDGRFVVFALQQPTGPNTHDLFIMGTDRSQPRPLLGGPANEHFPLWTPDGEHVLFLRNSPKFGFGSQDGWALSVINGVPQGDATVVASNISGEGLALTDTGTLHYFLNTAVSDAYTASFDLDGATPPGPQTRISEATIGNHAAPSWSPDGQWLAYMTLRANPAGGVRLNTLTIQDVRTRSERDPAVVLGFLGGYTPRWLPDGSVIVWGWNDRKRPGYFRVDVATGKTDAIVLGKDAPPFFSIGKNGRELLYTDERGIVARDLATGSESVVVAKGGRSRISWIGASPNGQSIAFVGTTEKQGQSVDVLEVQTLGGTPRELRRVPPPMSDLRYQAWTPDSQRVLYTTVRPGRPVASLWSIAVTGGDPRDTGFSLSTQVVNPISLSPNGRTIAYPERTWYWELSVTEQFWPPTGGSRNTQNK